MCGLRAWFGAHPAIQLLRTCQRPVMVVRNAVGQPCQSLIFFFQWPGRPCAANAGSAAWFSIRIGCIAAGIRGLRTVLAKKTHPCRGFIERVFAAGC